MSFEGCDDFRRQAMKPRGTPAREQENDEEWRIYFRRLHVSCRRGRLGRRPAKQPRYKNVRRGGGRYRKHA